MSTKPTPRKHAEVIKAWADGHTIQFRTDLDAPWTDVSSSQQHPQWLDDCEYRVKPAAPEVKWLWAVRSHHSSTWAMVTKFMSPTEAAAMERNANVDVTRLEWSRTEFPQE